jgi:hypothetical protein
MRFMVIVVCQEGQYTAQSDCIVAYMFIFWIQQDTQEISHVEYKCVGALHERDHTNDSNRE